MFAGDLFSGRGASALWLVGLYLAAVASGLIVVLLGDQFTADMAFATAFVMTGIALTNFGPQIVERILPLLNLLTRINPE